MPYASKRPIRMHKTHFVCGGVFYLVDIRELILLYICIYCRDGDAPWHQSKVHRLHKMPFLTYNMSSMCVCKPVAGRANNRNMMLITFLWGIKNALDTCLARAHNCAEVLLGWVKR